ncbi:hypothetical protein [uncultured Dysosmobacter sp.]|nr:hypothetical protein [uncultured Dysosmobacter sp.]
MISDKSPIGLLHSCQAVFGSRILAAPANKNGIAPMLFAISGKKR